MKTRDEAKARPAGRDQLERAVEPSGDLTKGADPLGLCPGGEVLGLLDESDGICQGELDEGQGRGVMVHWDGLGGARDGRRWTGVDHHVFWDNVNSILGIFTLMYVPNLAHLSCTLMYSGRQRWTLIHVVSSHDAA